MKESKYLKPKGALEGEECCYLNKSKDDSEYCSPTMLYWCELQILNAIERQGVDIIEMKGLRKQKHWLQQRLNDLTN